MGAITWAIIGICYMIYSDVNNGKYLDTANGLVYFNNDILRAAVSSGLFMFPCNVLYCGYNREIEKLPITASIA